MADFATSDIISEINKQAPNFGVDPKMATAFFAAENSSDGINLPAKVSGSTRSGPGALGVMQVMPSTAEGLRQAGFLPPTWKFNPDDLGSQVAAGLAAIKEKLGRVKNPQDPLNVAASYNGSNYVKTAYETGKPVPPETAKYFTKVTNALKAQGVQMPDPSTSDASGVPNLTVTPTSSTPEGGASTFAPVGKTGSTTNTSIESTHSPSFDPAALSNFNSAIGAADTATNDAAKVIAAGGQTRIADTSALITAVTAAAQAKGQGAYETALQEGQNNMRRQQALTQFNLDPDTANNLRLQTSGVINETDSQMVPLKAEIDQRMAVGMFDNPFQWLVNQTILPGLVAKYNGLVTTQNAAVDKLKTVEAIADKAQSQDVNIDSDHLLRLGVAKKEEAAATAQADAARARLDATAQQTRDATVLASLAQGKANLAHSALETTKQMNVIGSRDTTSDRTNTKAAEDQLLQNMNNVRKMAGGNPLASVQELKLMPAKDRALLEDAAATGKFGTDLPSSINFVKGKNGNMSVMAAKGGAGIAGWVNQAYNNASGLATRGQAVAAQTGQKFNFDDVKDQQLKTIQAAFENEGENDLHAGRGEERNGVINPLKLNYVNMAKLPELANNPLAIFINQYGPNGTVAKQFPKVNEGYIMDKFATSISDGTMSTPAAVKAITDFYKAAVPANAKATAWPLFGIQAPTKTYAVKFPELGVNKTLDMGNPADVENLLTRQVALKAMRAASEEMLLTNPMQ